MKKKGTSASIAEATLAKMKRKDKEDKTSYLTEEEFCAINWQKDWPLVIKNLA
jgi:hypothetical protein